MEYICNWYEKIMTTHLWRNVSSLFINKIRETKISSFAYESFVTELSFQDRCKFIINLLSTINYVTRLATWLSVINSVTNKFCGVILTLCDDICLSLISVFFMCLEFGVCNVIYSVQETALVAFTLNLSNQVCIFSE